MQLHRLPHIHANVYEVGKDGGDVTARVEPDEFARALAELEQFCIARFQKLPPAFRRNHHSALGGKIIAQNSLATNYVTLSVSGNGSMDVDLKGDVIKAEVSGSGKMLLRGYANSLDALVSGSGSINGFNCALETAKVKVSGSGLCELNVTNNLDALLLGSGSIKHKGNTKNVQKKVYGSGTVDRAY